MIKVIFAYSPTNGGYAFGNDDKLPWPRNSEDMKSFQNDTIGNVILMGSNTWKSLPSRLPHRLNCVLSREFPLAKDGSRPDMIFHGGLSNAIGDLQAMSSSTICIIGGLGVIEEAIHFADEIIMTELRTVEPCEATHFVNPRLLMDIDSWFVVDDKFEHIYDDGPFKKLTRYKMIRKT